MNASQTTAATYKYDPFGITLAQSGTLASANVYRFSSKEFHSASSLYYYGFRFYDPNLQRWLNRDPMGENGGINLYAFTGNDLLDFIDPFGFKGYRDSQWFGCIQKAVWLGEEVIDGVWNAAMVTAFTPPSGNSRDVITYLGNPLLRLGAYNPSSGKEVADNLVADLAEPIQSLLLTSGAGSRSNAGVKCQTSKGQAAKTGAGEMTSLYRAVSPAEYEQLMKSGTFQAGPNSLGGKFFAESAAHASQWGTKMDGAGNCKVIEAQFPKNAADSFMRWDKLDGIGPARYGELGPINAAKPVNKPVP
jgi:RHS repeat-associated protein